MRWLHVLTVAVALWAPGISACNDLYFGYQTVAPTFCGVDPRGGSNYAVPVSVRNVCNQNGVLYLSFSYTFPGGSETRTVTSADLGPQSRDFSSFFTFDIPNSYFPDSAIVTETYQFDNSPPATVLRTTKRYVPTLITTESTSSFTYWTQILQTNTYTYPATDNVISPAQKTVTSNCRTGTLTRLATSTSTITFTYSPQPFASFTSVTSYVTQTLRCTKAGGGIPTDFKPRLGEYEIEYCELGIRGQLYTTYYTGTASAIARTTYTDVIGVQKYSFPVSTMTVAPNPATTTVCNSPAATVTSTVTRTRYADVSTISTSRSTTYTITSYVTRTTARSVC